MGDQNSTQGTAKFCPHCGQQIDACAVLCVHCGCSIRPVSATPDKKDILTTIVKIFMIVGCISIGWLLLPLAWCIPMTVSVFKSLDEGRAISTGMKVCSLLFVNTIAGICMLCSNDI